LDKFCFAKGSDIIIFVPFREYKAEMEEGFEIDIIDIPKNIKTIRFVNSY